MKLLVAVAILVGMPPVFAAEPIAPDDGYVELSFGPECQANELTLSKCAASRRDHSDGYLKSLHAKILAELEPEQRVPFQAMIGKWIEFRDASCQFDRAGAAGNSAEYIYFACGNEYNKARIGLLSKYFGCLGGGCGGDLKLYYLVRPDGI